MDLAKRLLDYGFHAPTVYFPLTVPEAMMIEPTETESKETLDAFAETLFRITEESPELLHEAPHTTLISRPDEVTAARQPVMKWTATECRPMCNDHAVYSSIRPRSGTWNMAVDEALLERAASPARRRCGSTSGTSRRCRSAIFSARRATPHPASQDCPVVRRASGGGAILHDRELTYSIALPAGHRFSRGRDLYRVSHRALVEALEAFGVSANLHEAKGSSARRVSRSNHFCVLCTRRRRCTA